MGAQREKERKRDEIGSQARERKQGRMCLTVETLLPSLVADTRLFAFMCRSVGLSVGWLVHRSVCWLVIRSVTSLNCKWFCITAPAQLSATEVSCTYMAFFTK